MRALIALVDLADEETMYVKYLDNYEILEKINQDLALLSRIMNGFEFLKKLVSTMRQVGL